MRVGDRRDGPSWPHGSGSHAPEPRSGRWPRCRPDRSHHPPIRTVDRHGW